MKVVQYESDDGDDQHHKGPSLGTDVVRDSDHGSEASSVNASARTEATA